MADTRYSRKQNPILHLGESMMVGLFRFINHKIGCPWHKLGKWLGVFNLLALRIELRRHNLHDTDGDLTQPKVPETGETGCPFHQGPNATRMRTADGTLNDVDFPAMGCRFSRLGRNMRSLLPIEKERQMDEAGPNPYVISEKLLRRPPGKFKPATGLNLLAGAWIQFQVHDWFAHENEILTPNDGDEANDGKKIEPAWPGQKMALPKTRPDPTAERPLNSRHEVYRNKNPQWWDASQIYGEKEIETDILRKDPVTGEHCEGGRLYLDGQFLPRDPFTGTLLTGFLDNWWLGLEILHTLFVREHNAICGELKQREKHLTDQEIFETARLINCAIMAKIHTVQWTPGILGHPSIQPALDANWKGVIGHVLGEKIGEKTARACAPWVPFLKDVFTGAPMSETDHHGAPYALTEEFATVYRLHPLIPDEVEIKRCGSQEVLKKYNMIDIAFGKARDPITKDNATMLDVLWAFGTAHPGAICPQNYPDFLRDLVLPEEAGRKQHLDLAAVDIIRDRERKVPRYCEFRRQLRMSVPRSWTEMAGGYPELADELKQIYGGDLEAVDTIVGMFFEKVPEGFGFSDTAFRIFILMASRRLKSDRYFTRDYTEEVYTKTGLEWIAQTGMREVLVRHHPQLDALIPKDKNPFGPW